LVTAEPLPFPKQPTVCTKQGSMVTLSKMVVVLHCARS